MTFLKPSEHHQYATLLESKKNMDYDEAYKYIDSFLKATPSKHALKSHLLHQFKCPITAIPWIPTPRTLNLIVDILSKGEKPKSGMGYDDAHKWVTDFLQRVPSEEGLRVTAKNLWNIDLPVFAPPPRPIVVPPQTQRVAIPKGITHDNVADSILLAANNHPNRKMNAKWEKLASSSSSSGGGVVKDLRDVVREEMGVEPNVVVAHVKGADILRDGTVMYDGREWDGLPVKENGVTFTRADVQRKKDELARMKAEESRKISEDSEKVAEKGTSPTKSALSTVADSLMSGARKFLGFGQQKSPAKEHPDSDDSDEIVEISPPAAAGKRTSSTSQAKKRRASKKFGVWTCGWMGCAAELHDRPTLEKHVKSQHGLEAPSGGFPCVWQGCSGSGKMIEFETRPEILEHIQKEHSDPMRWACGVCTGLTFARKDELDGHDADFHPNIGSDPEEWEIGLRKRRKTGAGAGRGHGLQSSPPPPPPLLYTTPLAKPGPKGWTPKPPPGYSMPETAGSRTGSSGHRKGKRTKEEEEGKRSVVDRKTSGWIDSEDEEEVKVQRVAFEGPDVAVVRAARRGRELVPADGYRAKIARAAEEDVRVITGVEVIEIGSETPDEGGSKVKWARWLSYVRR
ncbi:hypothetical protein YB2330_003741 [Saitoella coloradoensis]